MWGSKWLVLLIVTTAPVGRCWRQTWLELKRLLWRQRQERRDALTSKRVNAKKRRKKRRKIQVVVDIDDTVKSSGNARLVDVPLGGIDGQYERGSFYPGVFEFVAELSNVTGDPEPVAVLTARARELKFALELSDEDAVMRGFKASSLGTMRDGWGIDVSRIMYGSLHEWLFQDFKAWRKFTNFELLADRLGDLNAAKPVREYVFVGDTGEMDRQAGELILARHPRLAKAVFLHCVSTSPNGNDVYVPVDYAVGQGRVYHFRTYVGAAAKACKAGYLDRAAFERVVAAALADVELLLDGEDDPYNRRRDIERDVQSGRTLLDCLEHSTSDVEDQECFDSVFRSDNQSCAAAEGADDDDEEDDDHRVVPITRLVHNDAISRSPFSFWRSRNLR